MVVMAKTKRRNGQNQIPQTQELDSVFALKIVMYLVLGSQWLRFETASGAQFPVPLGLLLGIAFAVHDHFQIDRKIEFAVMLVAAFVGFWVQAGLYISI